MKKLSNFAQISLKVRSWVPDSFGRFGSSPNRNLRFGSNRRRIGGLMVIHGTPTSGCSVDGFDVGGCIIEVIVSSKIGL